MVCVVIYLWASILYANANIAVKHSLNAMYRRQHSLATSFYIRLPPQSSEVEGKIFLQTLRLVSRPFSPHLDTPFSALQNAPAAPLQVCQLDRQ